MILADGALGSVIDSSLRHLGLVVLMQKEPDGLLNTS